MNIPDYVTSGILESYALGAVSDQERREVECLSAIYPELRQELDRLTLALENYALMHSVAPPASLQEKIRQRLTFADQELPAVSAEETKVIPLQRERPVFQIAWVAAAAVGLVLIAFAYFLINQLQQKRAFADQMAQTNVQLQAEMGLLRQQQNRDTQLLALLRQPDVKTIRLAAAQPDGDPADVIVYWDRQKKQVTLEVERLPDLPADKQYQLWALVDGKPVDAGVFQNRIERYSLQQTNRPIQSADTFAITVEKSGGSPVPTLTALVALGKVG
ncbi:anti-sigma factor [Fibrivirga algicola]|uniref:Regulator of SigK n=1 Tax=Fibrivirga algicola TaxID=2950420 RepID=A0ABX0QGV8_9BACT|nr:anti-sigma factor [Fibrivirga algicola]ARK12049.1 anti-sigma factor [Fibrella sp. ES10-3-2-2]NID11123.1 anti-sigma factor [Fibrivirga algicola]